MGFSDFILALLVLVLVVFGSWIVDFNPFTNQIQIYNQKCTKMILDNTFCKGEWEEQATITFLIDEAKNSVVRITEGQLEEIVYENCSIRDRKNWTCNTEIDEKIISVTDGNLNITETESKNVRQITRLEWLQNKLLKYAIK